MYQAVFFDAFNTLIGLHWPGKAETKRLPLQQSVERWLGRLDASWQATYGRVRTGQPAEVNFFSRLFAAAADRTGITRGSLLTPLRRNEEGLRYWFSVYEDTITTLQTLRESCKLGIISNAWPYLESVLRLLGLWDFFESVVISAQVGLSKPNPAIYELALRTLQLRAEQAIFVDDIPQHVLAAQQVGLKALWLLRRPVPTDNIPTYYRDLPQIYSLTQVIPLIEGA